MLAPRAGHVVTVAVLFFLLLVAVLVGVWAVVAYLRAGAKAADSGIDRTSAAPGPSLLEEDLSFAGRNEAPDDGAPEGTAEPQHGRTASRS